MHTVNNTHNPKIVFFFSYSFGILNYILSPSEKKNANEDKYSAAEKLFSSLVCKRIKVEKEKRKKNVPSIYRQLASVVGPKKKIERTMGYVCRMWKRQTHRKMCAPKNIIPVEFIIKFRTKIPLVCSIRNHYTCLLANFSSSLRDSITHTHTACTKHNPNSNKNACR